MKQKLYLFICLLGISMISFGQTLDQSHAPSDNGGGTFSVSPTQNVGQSFTAGVTGNLTQINIRIGNWSGAFVAGDFQLRIINGNGYGVSILNSTTFTLSTAPVTNDYQELVIPLSSSIPITSGSMYTIDFRGITGTVSTHAAGASYFNGGLYFSNGNNLLYNSYDLWFKTFMSNPTPATHLNFDGQNDIIPLTNQIVLPNEFTLEAWIKTAVDGTILFGSDTALNQSFLFAIDGAKLRFQMYSNIAGLSFTSYPIIIADNNWHHVALTKNASGLFTMYVDGVVSTAMTSPSGPIFFSQIGESTGTGVPSFNGSLDDVRIWNIAKTASEINASKNCELQGSETGLVAYYKFNQGNDTADNTAITSLTDATSNGNNGTLTNFTLNGTTSNFLVGSPVFTPDNAIVTTPVVYNQGATATALTATTGTNGSGLLWYTTATGGTGSTTAPTPSTASISSSSYWVSSTNANGCESARTEIVVTVNPILPATHLNFDGVNDRVVLPNESNFDFTSTFSMEAWIRVTSLTQEWQTIISKGAEGPRIHRFGFTNFIAFGTGPSNDLVSTVSVNDGNWHHIAAVCNNGVKTLYIDGVLQGTQTVGTPLVINNDNVRIGSQIDAYNPIRAFHGNIDEVRIWNVARTAEQINGSKNCELQGNETGLVANYKFNQGLDAADNTSITTLTDATANGNNGTLVNFAKTGTTSNFVAGSPVTTGSIIPSVATVTTPVTYNQCDTATALTATTGANGSGLLWYTTATSGIGTTTALTPSTTTAGNTSFWVSSTNANGCESARTEIVVTVNPSITAITSQTNVSCNGGSDGSATVGVTSGTAPYTYLWNNAATTASITGIIAGTYNVTVTDANGCSSGASVTITEPNVVLAPTASAQTFCNTATVADLVATGSGLQWYAASTGGSALASTTSLATATYYVSQTVGGCESAARTAVNVTVAVIGLIRQHWNDVIFFDNSSNEYVSYKWYKDGMLISGENRQFLKENGGLDGIYFAKAMTVSGIEVTSCSLEIVPSTEIRSIKVIPNPNASGQMTLIKMTLSATELVGAKLYLFSMTGGLLNVIDVTSNEMQIQVPYTQGIFPLRLELQNGDVLSVNIAVK